MNNQVFISFRRIRFPIGGRLFRDLMFSGLVPWLSDHSISTTEALKIEADPSKESLAHALRQS
jgi:hypothetical protein